MRLTEKRLHRTQQKNYTRYFLKKHLFKIIFRIGAQQQNYTDISFKKNIYSKLYVE